MQNVDIFHIITCFLTNFNCKCNTFFNKKIFAKICIIFSVNRNLLHHLLFKIKCLTKENHS